MKKVLLIFILLYLFIIYNYSQLSEDVFIKQIKDFKESNQIKNAKFDTSLSNIKLYSENKLIKNKDEIRKQLRSIAIYDYNVEVIEINFKGDTVCDLKKVLKNYPAFNKILKDSLFNKIGVKKINNEKIQVILTQNYIDFEKIEYVAPFPSMFTPNLQKTPYIVFKGRSLVKDIFYKKVNEKEDYLISDTSKTNPIIFTNNLKDFELKVNVNNQDFIFLDSEGKILSYFENFANFKLY